MEKELNLLKTFPPVNKEEWVQKATEDLKGADFDRKLVWKTYEGIPVQPFYTAEDTEGKQLPSEILNIEDPNHRTWNNYLQIEVADESEANRLAVKMIAFDATGILFILREPASTNLEILLKGLDLENLAVSFKTEKPSAQLIENYFNYCSSKSVALEKLTGFYQSDVLELLTTQGIKPEYTELAKILELTSKATKFYGLTIQSHAFADSGANIAQEIALVNNKLVEYITELTEVSELAIDEVFKNVLFHTAIGGDYFFEISKIRALRLVFQSIAAHYGVPQTTVQIVASSGLWTKSLFDPNVNLLRNTTEAMAAVLGGCDGLLIQPHDSSFQKPSDFSHRIALNVSNLLKGESHFDKVTDPSAGSYYIENLTDGLVEKALELFKEVESKNGFVKAFSSGFIPEIIQQSKAQKEKDITARKKVIVGTNKYPNLTEKVTVETIEKVADNTAVLQPQRASNAFDTLRLTTLKNFKETGNIPKVYLSCFGNLAMRKARATFAAEFFGIAGFQILGEHMYSAIEEAAKQAANSEGDIIVMCSSDQDYVSDGVEFATTFKSIAPEKQLVLAGYPADMVDSLKAAGVDSFIHVKTNAIEALSEYQNMLFEPSKTL
ncbi:methylmalonyl-CoA mutase family protein [Neptunitalea lumnitzerae]|uniref:Methylmalonyl-CoA mutase small subunit n=1 Tax=Neptunitalea lumnitzerae TaxID=2965509 RepID=A0ABQ5MK73_9FLAO|nr:methylmalonyl-CoA mutase family protein [Neptunitalea sp. Y10]GLB49317.1 methylmalonyl-CoA mutase small subunit [Neptunitalea sp. Y10]